MNLLATGLCFLLLMSPNAARASDEVASLFEEFRAALFQIKVIDTPSGNRSALGSGFAINDQLVVTNYHVISQFTENPDTVEIHILDHEGNELTVDIVAVDVVNDLAVLRSPDALPIQFELAQGQPSIGSTVYALGNPYDLGMSVTEGIYNGIKDDAFPRRIHYAGPVNSGMSGGPTVTREGQVVGVNVATARNSVGFLVPVAALGNLLNSISNTALSHQDITDTMGSQLWDTQESLSLQLLEQDWPKQSFGSARVPDKGADFMSCWGQTREENDDGLSTIARGCNSGNQIRLKGNLSSTYIEYEFAHISTAELGPFRFYQQAKRLWFSARPPNRVNKKDLGNFQCVEDHLLATSENVADTRFRSIYCSRAYRHIEGLYDAFYVGMTTDREQEILFTHFTLSGFSEANIKRFLQRFLESVHWES